VEYEGDRELELPMVPEHLYLVVTEIISNALRANAERFGSSLRSNSTIPPVRYMYIQILVYTYQNIYIYVR